MASIKSGHIKKNHVTKAVKANTWGKLRSYLAQEGYDPQWINDQLGGTPAGRKTDEATAVLRAAMRTEEAKRVRKEREKPTAASGNNGRGRG